MVYYTSGLSPYYNGIYCRSTPETEEEDREVVLGQFSEEETSPGGHRVIRDPEDDWKDMSRTEYPDGGIPHQELIEWWLLQWMPGTELSIKLKVK